MAEKKAITKNTESVQNNVITKSNNPLIFISHDTRDAELAEEFSNLLKSASTGALKSFVSSDKKGTRGIEYGVEWYPTIMDKIDEASEVICILTQQSIDRPWILYEAGVAKGKLGKKVIGIAMGIKHSVAFTGPFAQFQNNDGSIDAISKLVIDLIKQVPGLDPDETVVKQLVVSFHTKATEILAKNNEVEAESSIENEESTVPKLFEEIKIMFESLPSRVANRVNPEIKGYKKRRKFHPMMFDELMHIGMDENRDLGFLVLISLYKDDFPWLYEIGLETYRSLKKAKSMTEKERLMKGFENAFMLLEHPIFREMHMDNEEMYMMQKDTRHAFRYFIEKYLKDNDK